MILPFNFIEASFRKYPWDCRQGVGFPGAASGPSSCAGLGQVAPLTDFLWSVDDVKLDCVPVQTLPVRHLRVYVHAMAV